MSPQESVKINTKSVLLKNEISIVRIVILKPHEKTDDVRLKALKNQIISDKMLIKPIVVDKETNTVYERKIRGYYKCSKWIS